MNGMSAVTCAVFAPRVAHVCWSIDGHGQRVFVPLHHHAGESLRGSCRRRPHRRFEHRRGRQAVTITIVRCRPSCVEGPTRSSSVPSASFDSLGGSAGCALPEPSRGLGPGPKRLGCSSRSTADPRTRGLCRSRQLRCDWLSASRATGRPVVHIPIVESKDGQPDQLAQVARSGSGDHRHT